MFFIRNILKTRWMKASHVYALQYRCFRTSAYLTSTSSQKEIKAFQKFKLKQAKMQRDDGVPTYLKGGLRDKILFNITLLLFLFQMISFVRTMRELSKTT